MKDVLGEPRILLLAAAALATSLGIGAGWGGRAWIRGEDPAEGVSIEGGPSRTADRVPARPPEADLDYAAMLETLEAAGMRVVPERALRFLDAPVIGPDGRLSAVFADALLLSREEAERVNRILGESEIRLREAELDRMTVAERSDDRVVLRFGRFREEGAAIERMLRERIVGELGRTDGVLLLALMNRSGDDSSWDYWGSFGREEMSAVFEKETLETSGDVDVVEIRFSYGPVTGEESAAGAAGTGRVVRRAQVRTGAGENAVGVGQGFAGRHAHLYRVLPPELRRYFDREP